MPVGRMVATETRPGADTADDTGPERQGRSGGTVQAGAMMARSSFRVGLAELNINQNIADSIERVIRDLAGVVGAELEATVRQVTEDAERQWPLGDDKTTKGARNKGQPYHSREAFEYGLRVRGSYLEGYVDNYATNVRGQKYWFFIKTRQGGLTLKTTVKRSKVSAAAANEPGSPINAYIKRPIKEASIRIAADLATEIKALVRES